MRTHQLTVMILFIFASSYMFTLCRITVKKKPLSTTITSDNQTEKPAIIFDLVNVLFKENSLGFAQKIGYATLTSYAVTHWKNPGYRCLDMLNEISKKTTEQPHVCLTINDRTMPRCIVELHEGKKKCSETLETIMQGIEHLDKEKFFSSAKEKKLMCSIMNLMLDPATISHVTEPIKPMITLAQKLKQNGHKLYLFANVPDEFHNALQKKYPDIISLFDGIMISFQEKLVKPDKIIFERLLTKHNLIPHNCILIDTTKNSIEQARALGMKAILYNKPNSLTQELKKHGII